MRSQRDEHRKAGRGARRDLAVMTSALIFILGGGLPTMILASQLFGATFSDRANQSMSAYMAVIGLLVLVLALIVGSYAGIVLWLLCARYVFGFTYAEILRAVRAGPRVPVLSKFDDLLINRIYRNT